MKSEGSIAAVALRPLRLVGKRVEPPWSKLAREARCFVDALPQALLSTLAGVCTIRQHLLDEGIRNWYAGQACIVAHSHECGSLCVW
mmetsp:Transcript_74653/g.139377  ORF Transcript_74653/g.139377 Transcript_74653/m.139377 type:complete len:87 (+) Transcript_74653:320-580(+)